MGIVSNPVHVLLERGHPDPDVQTAIDVYLKHLVRFAERFPIESSAATVLRMSTEHPDDPTSLDRWRYYQTVQSIHDSINVLNMSWHGVMGGEQEVDDPHGLSGCLYALRSLRGMLGYASEVIGPPTEENRFTLPRPGWAEDTLEQELLYCWAQAGAALRTDREDDSVTWIKNAWALRVGRLRDLLLPGTLEQEGEEAVMKRLSDRAHDETTHAAHFLMRLIVVAKALKATPLLE